MFFVYLLIYYIFVFFSIQIYNYLIKDKIDEFFFTRLVVLFYSTSDRVLGCQYAPIPEQSYRKDGGAKSGLLYF